jgi:hypothetical protein
MFYVRGLKIMAKIKGRAGQGRAGQGRAGQGRAGQGRAGRLKVKLHCLEKFRQSNLECIKIFLTYFIQNTQLTGRISNTHPHPRPRTHTHTHTHTHLYTERERERERALPHF